MPTATLNIFFTGMICHAETYASPMEALLVDVPEHEHVPALFVDEDSVIGTPTFDRLSDPPDFKPPTRRKWVPFDLRGQRVVVKNEVAEVTDFPDDSFHRYVPALGALGGGRPLHADVKNGRPHSRVGAAFVTRGRDIRAAALFCEKGRIEGSLRCIAEYVLYIVRARFSDSESVTLKSGDLEIELRDGADTYIVNLPRHAGMHFPAYGELLVPPGPVPPVEKADGEKCTDPLPPPFKDRHFEIESYDIECSSSRYP
jgi:hypothetical protein